MRTPEFLLLTRLKGFRNYLKGLTADHTKLDSIVDDQYDIAVHIYRRHRRLVEELSAYAGFEDLMQPSTDLSAAEQTCNSHVKQPGRIQ